MAGLKSGPIPSVDSPIAIAGGGLQPRDWHNLHEQFPTKDEIFPFDILSTVCTNYMNSRNYVKII